MYNHILYISFCIDFVAAIYFPNLCRTLRHINECDISGETIQITFDCDSNSLQNLT